MEHDNRPLVGISACLAGQKVRYDGRDKFNAVIAERIAPHCRLLPFCPEAVAGLGIPRPPIQLVQTGDGVRALGRDAPTIDVTARLLTIARAFANSYPELGGLILQSRSPSCGLGTTPIHDTQQQVLDPFGSGLFAQYLQERFPDLPILDDTRLDDCSIREFLQNVRERVRKFALRLNDQEDITSTDDPL